MGLQFAESTNHIALVADITRKWTINVINSAFVGTVPDGSGKTAYSVGAGLGRTVDYQNDEWIGFRVYFDSAQGWSGTGQLYQWSCANENVLATVGIEHDGSISIWAGNSLNRVYNSGSFPLFLHPNTSYYIELHLVSSSGNCVPPLDIAVDVELWVNTVQIGGGSGDVGFNPCDTVKGTNQGNFHFFANANVVNGHAWMRDFYVATGLSQPYGDIGLGADFPNEDVSNTNWSAYGGTTTSLFDHINPQTPDLNDDTIGITANQEGATFATTFSPLAAAQQIPFVHYGIYHKKDAEGAKMFKLTMSGADVGNVISSGDDYRYDFVPLDTGPGGAPWTVSLFNSTNFGVHILD